MSWLDRQSFLGSNSDAVLADCKVGIVGLGGGGSHVAQQLAHVGIGSFVLVDPQEIEDTNLNRLVGGRFSDIERRTRKVEIARRLIAGVRPDAKIDPQPHEWQEAADALKSCDVIVGGLDSVRAKDELDAFCRRFLIPYIDMGMDVHPLDGEFLISGQVVLSSPGGPCLRCLKLVTEAALNREGANYGAAGGLPQVVWPNGVLASTAVGIVVQLVTPWFKQPPQNVYLEYDGNLGVVRPSDRLKIAAGRPCPHHPPGERGDPLFDIRRVTSKVPEIEKEPAASMKRSLWQRLASFFKTSHYRRNQGEV